MKKKYYAIHQKFAEQLRELPSKCAQRQAHPGSWHGGNRKYCVGHSTSTYMEIKLNFTRLLGQLCFNTVALRDKHGFNHTMEWLRKIKYMFQSIMSWESSSFEQDKNRPSPLRVSQPRVDSDRNRKSFTSYKQGIRDGIVFSIWKPVWYFSNASASETSTKYGYGEPMSCGYLK